MSSNVQSAPSLLNGAAQRISAADKANLEMNSLPALLRATIQITRAATGKVEEYEIVGTAADQQPTLNLE